MKPYAFGGPFGAAEISRSADGYVVEWNALRLHYRSECDARSNALRLIMTGEQIKRCKAVRVEVMIKPYRKAV